MDQRSVNVHQQEAHQHENRMVVLADRSMQVGMNPTAVQHREGAVTAEAFQAVSQVQSQKQEVEGNASPTIHQIKQSFTLQMSRAADLNQVDGYRKPTGPSIGGAKET